MNDEKFVKPLYVSDRQLSPIINAKPPTLRNWRCQRKGPPYVKLGRSVRYSIPEVLAWMERMKIVPED